MDLRHMPAGYEWVAELDAEFEDDDFEDQEELEDWPLDEDVRRLLHDR